jgi:ADP-ribose pyrophosphatase YjhB (NUDIX family)
MFFEPMKYCSACGAKVEFTHVEGDAVKRFVCTDCKTIHYTNPKIVVGVLAYWEDKVLLCKRGIEPRYGYWNLPAGYLEDGERSQDGAARETMEEAGAEVDIEGVLAVYNLPQANQVYIHFLAQLRNGKFDNGPESIESQLFTEEEIPWKEMAFSSSYFALKRFFEDRKKGVHTTHIGNFPETH